ncbi:response regulator transcription factor [Reichenbachiella sp. 5M10]|uniref:response regulator transcription factor n=1 Tax=Reichenbachiella sp. 5M10 TaxID=1889772 RepID=UPI001304066E|nr:LuxR C-terminal-related transcriptional regulator [Reichenbachiella sp. 5M10]
MEKNSAKVLNLWKEYYTDHLEHYRPYNPISQLTYMAALFNPGLCYCYILNLHQLEIEMIEGNVEEITGIKASELTIDRLISILSPHETDLLVQKEALVMDFYSRQTPKMALNYKLMYFFRFVDWNGRERTMMHQSIPLTLSKNGIIEHALSIHTDVSHFNVLKNDLVSFIGLNGSPSYFNCDPQTGGFDLNQTPQHEGKLTSLLSKREIEIIRLLAKGLKGNEIAKVLNLAVSTVRTHRKNMLNKSSSKNTAELVARCLIEGVLT